MPVAVVSGALLLVGEDLVGLGGFLELALGLGVARVLVGVELQGHLPIALLDLLDRGLALDGQDFVVIALGRRHRHGDLDRAWRRRPFFGRARISQPGRPRKRRTRVRRARLHLRDQGESTRTLLIDNFGSGRLDDRKKRISFPDACQRRGPTMREARLSREAHGRPFQFRSFSRTQVWPGVVLQPRNMLRADPANGSGVGVPPPAARIVRQTPEFGARPDARNALTFGPGSLRSGEDLGATLSRGWGAVMAKPGTKSRRLARRFVAIFAWIAAVVGLDPRSGSTGPKSRRPRFRV